MEQQQNDIYYPESFFTIDILIEILSEYYWPCKYELREGIAGDVIWTFPKCTLVISEGFESNMNAYFKNEEIGRNNMQGSLEIISAVRVLRTQMKQQNQVYKEPSLINTDLEIYASLKKVKDGLRNICVLIQTFLFPCVVGGDFSWVEEYNKQYSEL